MSKIVLCILIAYQSEIAAIEFKKPEVTFSFPDGWIEIPRNVLDKMREELQRQIPGAEVVRNDYGFQLENAKNWMEYPYILVQIYNSGRLSERQLQSIPKLDITDAVKAKTKAAASMMSNLSIGQMRYDESTHIIWSATKTDIVGVGSVSGISGLIPTENGMIQVDAHAKTSEFDRYLPIFESIIASTKVAPSIAYKPR